jgi:Derlin-2/3
MMQSQAMLRRIFLVVGLLVWCSDVATSSSSIGSRQPLGRSSSAPTVSAPWGIAPPLSTPVISTSTRRAIFQCRGGDSDDESDEESDSEDEIDENDFLNTFQEADDSDDFKDPNVMDRFIQHALKTPPFTKAYLGASIVATFFGWAFNQNRFPSILALDWQKVMKGFQIWRPFTAFLNLGSFGIGYILTLQFVWQYSSQMERMNHNKPYDFWILYLFGMVAILVGLPVLKLDARLLGHNLSTYLVYVWSRSYEGLPVAIFEFVTTRAELLPWFFLLQSFLLEGEVPWLDFYGIVFGHVYYHLKSVGILRAPAALVNWYENSPSAKGVRDSYKDITSEFEVI